MTSFARGPQEAVLIAILISGALAIVASGILRRCGAGRIWIDLLVPAFFLFSYWLTYNKVPTFPPVGAVNKLFYIALAGTFVGLLVELLGLGRASRWALILFPAASAAYVGQARLTVAPLEVAAAGLAGIVVFYLMSRDMFGEGRESALRPAVVLAVASAGFAPIALMGASSSSLQLGLGFAASIAGILVWHLARPNFAFGSASLLGGLGGLVAAVQTVALITRKVDLAALVVLGLVFLVPLASGRILDRLSMSNTAIRTMGFAALCIVPALAAVAVAFIRYGGDFPM
jgi:hypothetical protein